MSKRLFAIGVVLAMGTSIVFSSVKGVHHTTVITWVKQIGELLPNAYAPEESPQVGELDELQTFVGSKKKEGLDMDGG